MSANASTTATAPRKRAWLRKSAAVAGVLLLGDLVVLAGTGAFMAAGGTGLNLGSAAALITPAWLCIG